MSFAVPKVLVVDDHADTRRSIGMLLELLGYACEAAGSTREALAKAAAKSFDVLFTDMGLPDDNGWELVRRLEEHGNLPARVILMSAWVLDDQWKQSQAAGRYPHLSKPFTVEELARALQLPGRTISAPAGTKGTVDRTQGDTMASP